MEIWIAIAIVASIVAMYCIHRIKSLNDSYDSQSKELSETKRQNIQQSIKYQKQEEAYKRLDNRYNQEHQQFLKLKHDYDLACRANEVIQHKLDNRQILSYMPPSSQNECAVSNENNQIIQAQDDEIKRLRYALKSSEDELKNTKDNMQFLLGDYNSVKELMSAAKSIDQQTASIARIKERIEIISLQKYAQIPDDFKDSILTGRLANAFNSTDISINGKLNILANIQSGDHYYETSLLSCTCPDFQNKHKPCKHMLFLAYTSGLMLLNKEVLSDFAKNNIYTLNRKIEQEKEASADAKRQNSLLRQRKREMQKTADRLQRELDQSYPWLAGMYKRFQIEQDNHDAYMLSDRSTTSKDIVKKLKKKNASLKYEKALYENQLLVYESLFPWLEEFKKVDIDKAVEYVKETQSDKEYDRVSDYLSPAEYKTLSSAEKSQLALDRYKKHRKSDWEIGIDYERYIGYRYETNGYKVSYTGAIDYLKDMGRDLICTKDDEALIIQCKRWSSRKTIHEKHIFQLFGSTIQLKYANPNINYKPILYTTTKLSDVARYCAEQLNVKVIENEKFNDYPCIKCNISKNGDRIYHLPFDQQYDRISIETEKGEFYAMTTEEAENVGFRRAFKHKA